MTILCLCKEENHRKLLPAYARALRARGVRFFCVDWSPRFDSPLETLLQRCPEKPTCILQVESDFPLLPEELVRTEIPTVCLDVDTYAYTKCRMRWSSLFDHVGVFHPGYEGLFRRSGHPGAFLLPHAVCREFFDQPELSREFEVGWVGLTSGPFYRKRREWMRKLANAFRMNDWRRTYSLEEVAGVYRRSRVVVNIGRDDYPQDANMRVFEVLASGALLLTSLPSELSELGFQDGVHFVGYRQDSEIKPFVRRFLKDEPARARIAQAARKKVLQEHTYDCRADQLLRRLQQYGHRKLAPARAWPETRVHLTYLDFFSAQGVLDCAGAQFRHVAGHGFRQTVEGLALLGKAWMRGFNQRRGIAA